VRIAQPGELTAKLRTVATELEPEPGVTRFQLPHTSGRSQYRGNGRGDQCSNSKETGETHKQTPNLACRRYRASAERSLNATRSASWRWFAPENPFPYRDIPPLPPTRAWHRTRARDC